jgi:hypothetical protein
MIAMLSHRNVGRPRAAARSLPDQGPIARKIAFLTDGNLIVAFSMTQAMPVNNTSRLPRRGHEMQR